MSPAIVADADVMDLECSGESPLCSPSGVGNVVRALRKGTAAGAGPGAQAVDGAAVAGAEGGKRKRKKKRRRVVINTTFCKYDLVRGIAADNDWIEDANEDGEKGEFNVFWTDSSVAIYRVMRLQNWQRINHFPSMCVIARKTQLANTLAKMRKAFPQHFSFAPRTWSLRSERNNFKKYAQSLPVKRQTFIVKPSAGSQGKGIFLTQDPADLPDEIEDAVIQEYIPKPLLCEDKKFDLRVYALVTSVKCPSIFLFDDGLVRLCTVDYQKPAEDNLNDLQMHLTNYAINRLSENFVFNHDADDGSIGHKRDFAFFNKWLEAEGHSSVKVWTRIEKVIVKTLLAAQPLLAHVYTSCFPHNNDGYTCFEILGFDLLLDQQLRPWLLEVNHSPSFSNYTPLDERIKKGLIAETVKLLNLKTDDRARERDKEKEEFKRRMEAQARRAMAKKSGADDSNEVRELDKEDADADKRRQEQFVEEKRRDEDSLLTNFRRIYPSPDPARQALYEEFMEVAKEVNAPTTTVATAQREQEGRKEREKQREKQEKEEALRRGLTRTRTPPRKREVNAEGADGAGRRTQKQAAMEDALKTEQWQARLERQMERHRRRISLGPRLSVFQLREQYMTVPIGLPSFDDNHQQPDEIPAHHATAQPVAPPKSASHGREPPTTFPLRFHDTSLIGIAAPTNPAAAAHHPDPPRCNPTIQSTRVATTLPHHREPVPLAYVIAPCVMPAPKLQPPIARGLRQLKPS